MRAASARRGTLLVLLAATCWATLGLFGKALYRYEVDALVVISVRVGIATLTLGVALAIFHPAWLRIRKGDIPFYALFGLLGVALNYATYFLALKSTSMATTVIIFYCYPFLVLLGAAIWLKEKLQTRKLAALGLCLAGLVLVSGAYNLQQLDLNRMGVIYSLLSAVGMAAYNLLAKKSLGRYSGWTTLFYALLFGGLFLLLWQAPRLGQAGAYPAAVWALILGMVWVPTLLGYAMYLLGLGYLEAGQASIVAYAELVIAVILAYLFLDERLTAPQLVGGLLILGALFLLQTNIRQYRGREVDLEQEMI